MSVGESEPSQPMHWTYDLMWPTWGEIRIKDGDTDTLPFHILFTVDDPLAIILLMAGNRLWYLSRELVEDAVTTPPDEEPILGPGDVQIQPTKDNLYITLRGIDGCLRFSAPREEFEVVLGGIYRYLLSDTEEEVSREMVEPILNDWFKAHDLSPGEE